MSPCGPAEATAEQRESIPSPPSGSRVSARLGECLGQGPNRTRAEQILYGSAYSPFGGNNPLGGVRTAALESLTYITKAPTVIVDVDGRSVEPQPISYRALFPLEDVKTAEVAILDDGVVREQLAAVLDANGTGEVKLPSAPGIRHFKRGWS